METNEMKYMEIVGAVSKAVRKGFDVEMICRNGTVFINAGKTPQIIERETFLGFTLI